MSSPHKTAGAFHAREGWYFRRGEGGTVTIWCGEGHEITLDPDSWASVVASVSAQGESSATYRSALDAHQSQP